MMNNTQNINDITRFDPNADTFSEAYYTIWNDVEQQRSMVIRYVLFNGGSEDTQMAELWCWFRDQPNHIDCCYRQYYPLNQARYNKDEFSLTIGDSSGINNRRAWGLIISKEDEISWDFKLDKSHAIAVNRLPNTEDLDIFPQFQSTACQYQLNAKVSVNDSIYESKHIKATDGHYWNVQYLQNWSWMNAINFAEDQSLMLEAIGFRLYQPNSPVVVSATTAFDGQVLQNSILESIFKNQQTLSTLDTWHFEYQQDGELWKAQVTGNAEDMIIIQHPLPDGGMLYTTISLCADVVLQCYANNGDLIQQYHCQSTASFEITSAEHNQAVQREFIRIPAPEILFLKDSHNSS